MRASFASLARELVDVVECISVITTTNIVTTAIELLLLLLLLSWPGSSASQLPLTQLRSCTTTRNTNNTHTTITNFLKVLIQSFLDGVAINYQYSWGGHKVIVLKFN